MMKAPITDVNDNEGGAPDAVAYAAQPSQSSLPARSHRFMSVKQVAEYLQLNEKKVYALASEGKIPGTKITGKWLFPRDLVDQWLLESSHGGVFTDRLIVAGSDDPLLNRVVVNLVDDVQARALVNYTCTGTQLGLSLLSTRRADACGLHWGPAAESHLRHPALLTRFPQHQQWVLVRAFRREQGLITCRTLDGAKDDLGTLFNHRWRWVFRQEGAGSQRYLRETAATSGLDLSKLNVVERANSEREAASIIAMGMADLAPGARSAAGEFGLGFISMGWECFDLALYRAIYFRTLFQKLLDDLKSARSQALADTLGGYDFSDVGKLVWSS